MADYVLGNLSPEEAEMFKQLLETNPELITETSLLQEILNLMPHALPQKEPPPYLRAAILETAQKGLKAAPYENLTRSNKRQRSLSINWVRMASAAVVLLALFLGVDNYRLRQELRETRSIATLFQQPGTMVRSLAGTDSSAIARLIINPHKDQIAISISNLPHPPNGKSYRLWAIAGKEITYCGQFATDETGATVVYLNLPIPSSDIATSELRITLDPSDAPPQPTGQLVMKSTL